MQRIISSFLRGKNVESQMDTPGLLQYGWYQKHWSNFYFALTDQNVYDTFCPTETQRSHHAI